MSGSILGVTSLVKVVYIWLHLTYPGRLDIAAIYPEMSYQTSHDLLRSPMSLQRNVDPKIDMMAAVTTMNRIARVACERIVLMMNNSGLVKQRRLSNMNQVLTYLRGMHDDVGLSGDRGDFYRRKLAEQMFTTYAVEGVDHYNVHLVVEAAITLEAQTRQMLTNSAETRDMAPPVDIDEQILNILSRIAGVF